MDLAAESAPASEGEVRGLHLVLVDGSGFVFRAFHALPPMARPDGTPVNAVFGFCNMLIRLLREHVGTHFAVVFDAGRLTFRNRLYKDYKAHRPPPPEEMVPQFSLVREATEAFGVSVIEASDWEADDLIASYALAVEQCGGLTTIISSDKDLMQLIRPGVEMLDPIKQRVIGPEEVVAKFGVPPEKMAEVQALIGDASDNVPGVPGIGLRGAAQLINEFGTVEAVLAAAPSMKVSKRRSMLMEHADSARVSRELVELRADAPRPIAIKELVCREPNRSELASWLRKQGFRSMVARLGLSDVESRVEANMLGAPTQGPVGGVQVELELGLAVAFGSYKTISTVESLRSWVAAAEAAGRIAIGAETDGLDPMRASLIGLSLSVHAGQACYVPLAHELLTEQLSINDIISVLGPVLENEAILKILQNAKHGMLVLARAGLPIPTPVDDPMLISYAQDAGLHGHGLEELVQLHLGHRTIGYDEVTGTGRNRLAFSKVPVDRATAYAGEAADAALRLWDMLHPALRTKKALRLYEHVERPLVPVLLEMERAGIKVDVDDLRKMSVDFEARMANIEKDCHRLAGRRFNVASPKQTGEILFDEQQLPGGRRMKTGAWGTDSSILQSLADQGYGLPNRILEWRQLQKLKSTYADSLVNEIHPETNRIHTCFAMAIASTGRLSSTNPNLQNIPIRSEEGIRIRRAFIAEPGHLLVTADYSQIELRLLAHVADLLPLKESFARGEDIHARTASEVFGLPMKDMDITTRRRAKAINFGIIYGISGFGLARQLGISPTEAHHYISNYLRRYPGIQDYMDSAKGEARRYGYVTSPFGRRCWIPGISDRNPARRAYAERQAINAPLQGGAADIIKRAMVRIPAALCRARLKSRLLLQVHDELLFEAPEGEADELAKVVQLVMESAAVLSVPLVVETGVGPTWAEAH